MVGLFHDFNRSCHESDRLGHDNASSITRAAPMYHFNVHDLDNVWKMVVPRSDVGIGRLDGDEHAVPGSPRPVAQAVSLQLVRLA